MPCFGVTVGTTRPLRCSAEDCGCGPGVCHTGRRTPWLWYARAWADVASRGRKPALPPEGPGRCVSCRDIFPNTHSGGLGTERPRQRVIWSSYGEEARDGAGL